MNRDKAIKDRVETLKAKEGFQQAYERVKRNHEITTGDLDYFGIALDSFLRYAQYSDTLRAKMITNLLEMFK